MPAPSPHPPPGGGIIDFPPIARGPTPRPARPFTRQDEEMHTLDRRAAWYWYLMAGVLLLAALTVALQYMGGLAREGLSPDRIRGERWPMIVGLVGLIILFILYITLKRGETDRLRVDLTQQRLEVARIEARTTELEGALDRLKRLDEMKDSFLSTVAHELRTPLAAIQGYSEALMSRDDASQEIRAEFLGIINREARRLALLINDLQDLARLEAGRADWNTEPHEIPPLVAQAAATMEILARDRGLDLQVSAPSGLPRIDVDANRLLQVLTNLIGNAVKFTDPPGRIEVSARLEEFGRDRAAAGPAVRISVRDTGCGISPEDLPHIFDRFYRGGGSGDRVEGTGLGLAIAKEIVERLGGRLWAESVPGSGSTFHVTLPVPAHVLLEKSP